MLEYWNVGVIKPSIPSFHYSKIPVSIVARQYIFRPELHLLL
jgi:hypothetical protein